MQDQTSRRQPFRFTANFPATLDLSSQNPVVTLSLQNTSRPRADISVRCTPTPSGSVGAKLFGGESNDKENQQGTVEAPNQGQARIGSTNADKVVQSNHGRRTADQLNRSAKIGEESRTGRPGRYPTPAPLFSESDAIEGIIDHILQEIINIGGGVEYLGIQECGKEPLVLFHGPRRSCLAVPLNLLAREGPKIIRARIEQSEIEWQTLGKEAKLL